MSFDLEFLKYVIHYSSQTVDAMLLYSDSAKDLLTIVYFFVFQEIKEGPRKTQKLVKDFLVVRHAAQSASQKVEILKSLMVDLSRSLP